MTTQNTPRWEHLWVNAQLATMCPGQTAYGMMEGAAVATSGDRITWIGSMASLPGDPSQLAQHVVDCAGHLVTPGLIDCHTHLVHGGNRAREFEMRLNGATYEELSRAGGGINSTVRHTREASEDELHELAVPRVRRLMADGVTTVEVKSGYGLSTEDESKMLRAARRLSALPVTVKTTFLGAHAMPDEYSGRKDAYIDLVCQEMLPAAVEAGLADAVDGFCEGIGFDLAQMERVFDAADHHKLPIKLHAEQLSNCHGAAMAARRGALSVDHLEYLDEPDTQVLAEHGTVAVLLPGAFFCLREKQLPPIAALRAAGVPIAISTDENPGSSPVGSLLLMLGMGCTLFQLTPEETLAGVTRHAASALGLQDDIGTLEVGKRADLVLWHVREAAELSYRLGDDPCNKVLYGGQLR
jgi:imidazolonepropionase